jgi:hypothetical protein
MRGKFLEERQKTLTGKSFRDRLPDVELNEAEERRLSGKRAANPDCAKVPELHVPTRIDGADREDVPMPPPQTKEGDDSRVGTNAKAKPDPLAAAAGEGADDVRSDPSLGISAELFAPEKWNFSNMPPDLGENEDDDDEEEG